MTPTPPATTANLYDVLHERGLVSQCTDDKIRERLAKPVSAYCGFDPTADSLHVGSLVPIMGLAHLQRCGHKPVVLVGGATGLVGDPSGKTEARQMLSAEDINHNAQSIAKQIGRVVRFDDSQTGAMLVNNLDWFGQMKFLDMLRDVGSRMSVNRMMSMESVKGRMAGDGESGGGISFLEFSYMLLQGYDFAHLFDKHRCTLQLGGQDQWGNIVIGIDLGRRLHDADLAGLTFPLVTKSDGGKFGKSEQGNVWLDVNRTSVFEFFQFWRNVDDKDVGRFLGYFTFLPMDEVNALASAQGKAINESKVRLAYEVTKLVHGEDEANKARDSAGKAFSGAADVTGDAIPSAPLSAVELNDGVGLIALVVKAGFESSNGRARKLIQGGGVRVHDAKVTDPMHTVTPADVVDGYVLVRAGKKRLFRFDVC
ncbi:MAG: tyrosine--tRNA ligase [Phycisphaeraceae bacterium]